MKMSSPSPTPLPPGERKKRKNGLSHQGRGKRNKTSPTEGREKTRSFSLDGRRSG